MSTQGVGSLACCVRNGSITDAEWEIDSYEATGIDGNQDLLVLRRT